MTFLTGLLLMIQYTVWTLCCADRLTGFDAEGLRVHAVIVGRIAEHSDVRVDVDLDHTLDALVCLGFCCFLNDLAEVSEWTTQDWGAYNWWLNVFLLYLSISCAPGNTERREASHSAVQLNRVPKAFFYLCVILLRDSWRAWTRDQEETSYYTNYFGTLRYEKAHVLLNMAGINIIIHSVCCQTYPWQEHEVWRWFPSPQPQEQSLHTYTSQPCPVSPLHWSKCGPVKPPLRSTHTPEKLELYSCSLHLISSKSPWLN